MCCSRPWSLCYLWGNVELRLHVVLLNPVPQSRLSGLHRAVQQRGDLQHLLHRVAIGLVHILCIQLNVSFVCLKTQQRI